MKKCEWDQSLETGISEVDIQHRVLFNLAKILMDSLENDREDEVIDGVLDELTRYTIYHTVTESAYHIGSEKDLKEHQEAHEGFIVKVQAFKKERKEMGNKEFATFLADFVCHWIEDHIKGMDMRDLPKKS